MHVWMKSDVKSHTTGCDKEYALYLQIHHKSQ